MKMRIPAVCRMVALSFVLGLALAAGGPVMTGNAQVTVNGVTYSNLSPDLKDNPEILKLIHMLQSQGKDVEKELGKLTGEIDDKQKEIKGMTMTPAKPTDMLKQADSCMEYSWSSFPICCGGYTCGFSGNACCFWGTGYPISYWEVSEIIEVSCRTGYSMISPGKVPTRGGGVNAIQTCVGANKPGVGRWFFEARSWAVNGYDGGFRHQGAGGTNGERMRQCTMQAGDDLPWPGYMSNVPYGYGKKWPQFSRGSANGPAGSWEGYMSDGDEEWAKNRGDSGGGGIAVQGACKPDAVDMANCWGPVTQTGWVNHPNPKVAAALAAWRAHQKALGAGKVSPDGGNGFKMAMEYPWLEYGGAHAASMGLPNGGKTGSKCFKPGDAGPSWYGGKKPEEIPAFVAGLKQGEVAQVSEVNPGVYIFSIWVKTSCVRYNTPVPTPICHYNGIS